MVLTLWMANIKVGFDLNTTIKNEEFMNLYLYRNLQSLIFKGFLYLLPTIKELMKELF